MLVHMTPNEVQGLQSLAMAHGGSLTINPQTGLPEAGFLDAILPTVAGLGLNAMFPGLGALGSGLLVGGVTALASGDITKGLMAGLGAGAGAGLGNTFANMGQNAVGGITGPQAVGAVENSIVQQLPQNVAQNAATNMGMANAFGAQVSPTAMTAGLDTAQAASNIGNATSNLGGLNTFGPAGTATQGALEASKVAAPSLMDTAGTRLGQMGEGFKQFASDPFDKGYDAFKAAGGTNSQLFSPIASVAMDAMTPEPLKPFEDPDKGKWRGPQGQLNLSDKFDTGLRLANGGVVGSSIGSGGVRDLYGATDNQQLGNLSTDGYGLGRLNALGAEQSMNQAQTYGYADGGDVDVVAGEKGMNLNDLPSLNVNTGEQTYPNRPSDTGYKNIADFVTRKSWNLMDAQKGGMREMPNPFYMMMNKFDSVQGRAKGGYLDGAGDGMSDSIPATIDGKQPARLADGEFVVPADVVSHLGNGSSKAGSKRLYNMLDKVRKARTGHTKQGKEINPDKYMPA
jgi:hypothetical protein